MIDLNEKLQLIENKRNKDISEDDFYTLDILSKESDSEIRSRVAELLGSIPCDQSERILLSLLEDEDMIVRVQVCDSLGFSKNQKILHLLCKKAKHEQWMVRGYAVLSIGDIAKKLDKTEQLKTYHILNNLLSHEKSRWVKLSYYYAFILLGKTNYYSRFIDKIDDRDYHIRCAVCNGIPELIDKDNYVITEKKLQDRLKLEDVNAVIISLERVLFFIKERFPHEPFPKK